METPKQGTKGASIIIYYNPNRKRSKHAKLSVKLRQARAACLTGSKHSKHTLAAW